jgi:hypothetical protein
MQTQVSRAAFGLIAIGERGPNQMAVHDAGAERVAR